MRIALYIALFTALLMVVIKLLAWRRRPETRPCSWFGHDKKYVAIKTYNVVSMKDPTSDGKPLTCGHAHKIGDKGIYSARWACRRCPVLGEDCVGNAQDWKIYNEQLVPDVKKWANWSQPLPDPNEAAREKLKQLQERLDAANAKNVAYCEGCRGAHTGGPCPPTPPPVVVKTELVKASNYCQNCGWNHDGPRNPPKQCHCGAIHTGPCVPGGIS